MTSDEIRKILGIDAKRLARWLEAGMPHKLIDGEPDFVPDQVSAWLLETGRATRDDDTAPQTIARTIPEVANYFGVSINAVAKWLKDPTFPGQSGERGRQNGRFPLEAITEWKEARDGTRADEETGISARERKWLADAEIRELELAKLRGELIEVEVVAAEIAHMIHNAKAVLLDLTEEMIDDMGNDPVDDIDAFKRRQRKLIDRRIRQVLDMLADAAIEERTDDDTTSTEPEEHDDD